MASRKAISPVIATVIIVAVTIAVSIAVAFWLAGIVGLFTATEKLEITSAVAQPAPDGGGWTVALTVKNTGTTTTSIDYIMINGIKVGTDCPVTLSPQLPLPINPGEEKGVTIGITAGGKCGPTTFTPGLSIEIKLHSTGGKEYPKLLVLP